MRASSKEGTEAPIFVVHRSQRSLKHNSTLPIPCVRIVYQLVDYQVVVFLTSAVEVQHGWLEPLLSRLAKKDFTLVAPVVDYIDEDDFAYTAASGQDSYGVFGWDLEFLWAAGDVDQSEDLTEAIETPHIKGSLFAITRRHFLLLSGFDDVVCGTVDSAAVLALVLKVLYRLTNPILLGGCLFCLTTMVVHQVWLCGGKVEVLPCSHVGLVNRC